MGARGLILGLCTLGPDPGEASGADMKFATKEPVCTDWRGACGLLRTTLCNAGRRAWGGGEEFRRSDTPCPVRYGKVPSYGRVPADQAPPHITDVVRCQPSTTRDRPLVGFGPRNEGRGCAGFDLTDSPWGQTPAEPY